MLRILFGIAVSVLGLVTVKDCSTSSALFPLSTLDYSPSNPVPGENGTLHMGYHVTEDTAGGEVNYLCVLNGLPVLQETYDLCTATPCPITVGDHDQRGTVETPSVKGTLVCSLKWHNLAQKELLCVKITYTQPALRGYSIKDEL